MKRWDGDERGRGVGEARRLLPGAEELVAALAARDWVAEQPEAHLLPHLARACARAGSHLELRSHHVEPDGSFVIQLLWTGTPGDLRAVRAAVYALVGEVAETATYIRQRRETPAGISERASESDGVTFEVATGMLSPDTPFAPHGHVLLLAVGGGLG